MLFKILEVYARPDFPEKLRQHIVLSLVALLVAIAIAMPVALLIRNTRVGAPIAINVGNVGRAVPSLAILALALPLFGIGFGSALVALTALAIPPILINASTGLEGGRQGCHRRRPWHGALGEPDPDPHPVAHSGTRDLRRHQDLSRADRRERHPRDVYRRRGPGDLIVEGYSRRGPEILLAGALAVAILAIITEIGFGVLERVFTPKGLKIAQKRGK